MQPSEMTNEKILSLAELCFFEDHSVEEDHQTASVLRDYVRMRRQIAELREENAHLRAALKPVLECKVMSAMTAEIAPGRSKYCATIIEEAQHIYNEGEAK